jgi:hypothetical protein
MNIHEKMKKSLITLISSGFLEVGYLRRELMENKETIIFVALFVVALVTGVAMCNI